MKGRGQGNDGDGSTGGMQDEFMAYRMLLQAYDAVNDGSIKDQGGGGLEKVLIASLNLRRSKFPNSRTIKLWCSSGDGLFTGTPTAEGELALACALEVILALAWGNYPRVFSILRGRKMTSITVSGTLIRCLIFNLLPIMRYKVIRICHQAWGPQTIALQEFGHILCIQKDQDLLDFCDAHDITILSQDGHVISSEGAEERVLLLVDTLKVNLKKSDPKKMTSQSFIRREDDLVLGGGCTISQLWEGIIR